MLIRGGIVAVLGMAAIACGAQSRGSVTPTDESTFERAMQAMQGGDVDTAEPLLEALQRRYPASFEINESLGLLYAGTNRIPAAVPLLRAAVREQANLAVAHANLGTAYLKLGQNADAVTELQKAATLDPANTETQSALGQAWMLGKQPCRAASAFDAAAAHGNANDDLAYNTALADFDCGRPQQAEDALGKMSDAVTSANAQVLLGDICESLKQYKDAAQHYASAAQIAPTEENIYLLGVEFLRHWSFDPAIQTFADGARAFPASRRMLAGEGIAEYGAARYDDAIHLFAGLLQDDPGNDLYGEIFGRACTVLTTSTDPDCAQMTALAQAHPDNPNLALYAATQILHQPADGAQLELAQELLHSALARQRDLPEAHYQLGLALQQAGKWPESVAELKAAIAQRPDYAQAHYRLGLAYAHMGNKPAAAREMSLDREESEANENTLNARMGQITTLLVKMR